MSGLKAIVSPLSPFARKVRVTLLETGLSDRVALENVSTSALESNPVLVAANPLGKLPALLREDGPMICDSRVICRYLDSLSGGRLYPEARVWEVLTLEALADGVMEAAVLMAYEHRLRPEEKVFPEWVEAQWAKAARTLSVIDARWMSHLAGPLDAAQIALGCALGYIDLRHGARNWREGNVNLAAWYEAFSARPAMQATVPA